MERVCEQMNHQVYSTFQGLKKQSCIFKLAQVEVLNDDDCMKVDRKNFPFTKNYGNTLFDSVLIPS